MKKTKTILALGLVLWAPEAVAEDVRFSLPIDCKIGSDCFVQQYMDVDPGPGSRDYRCGSAVYDKHAGTDFRVRTVEDVRVGVQVLAAAPGRVLRVRDSVPDKIVSSAADRNAIQNVFCGNGLIIDHGGGWQTQYCHMRRGSLQVKSGDMVERGAPLGQVGFSGFAQFPHLHLTVYKGKDKIDPFTGQAASGACDMSGTKGLWDETTRAMLTYQQGTVLSSGFSTGRVTPGSVLHRLPDEAAIASNSPALVAYGWWINLKKDDRVSTRLTGPQGVIANQTGKPLNRDKAQYVQFAGKKQPKSGWPAGKYVSEVAVIRDGVRILASKKSLQIH